MHSTFAREQTVTDGSPLFFVFPYTRSYTPYRYIYIGHPRDAPPRRLGTWRHPGTCSPCRSYPSRTRGVKYVPVITDAPLLRDLVPALQARLQ